MGDNWGDTLDRALVHEVAGWAQSRLQDPFSLAGLSEVEADVLGTVTAIGVIGKGGFAYWYEGKNRDETLSIAAAFDRMGVPAVAQAMRRSLAAFPEEVSPKDYISGHRRQLKAEFQPFDKIVWNCAYDLLAARYVFRRRQELLAVEPAFGPLLQRFDAANRRRTERLLSVAGALGSDARAACERAVDDGDLTAALDQAMSAGTDNGAEAWDVLAEVARALGHLARAEHCEGWSRVARRGALRVAVTFVPASELRDGDRRGYGNGDQVSWNVGDEPAGLFRSRRAEFFFAIRERARPGHETELFLVPCDGSASPGMMVVLHQDGEIIGRGEVLERRRPKPA